MTPALNGITKSSKQKIIGFFHEFHIFFQVKRLEVHSAGGEAADLSVDAITGSVKRSVSEMDWALFSVPDF